MRNIRLAVTTALCLLPLAALGQDASAPLTDSGGNIISQAYTYACANRDVIEPILIGALGTTGVLHGIGIWMKKSSITKATPYLYKAWQIIRFLNADVKPRPATIVAQGADILAAKPEVVAATGVSPDKMAAAAEALKTAAKT